MMQYKDPAIKLFGKTIPIRAGTVFDDDEFGGVSAVASCSGDDRASSAGSELGAAEKEKVSEERIIVKGLKQEGEDESVNENITLEANENQINALRNDETVNPNNRSSDISEEANSEERTPLKKPDKVLQCPRCESMSTKFCYYNNYNVLQPRHFCKGCQRYWTAGGSMRNVPDGAGRRRSKNYALQKHYLTISEVLQASGAGSPNGMVPGHQGLKCGSVSTVDSDATVCASTGSVSNLKVLFGASLTHKVNEVVVIKPHNVGEINSSGSCITASNETESKHHANTSPVSSFNGSEAQMPCIPAWPYPWNAVIRPPALQHPWFSLPFVHPNYWPCTAIPNTWNAPWLTPQSLWQTDADVGGNPNSKPSVLGKHSRDGEVLQRDTPERQASPKQISVLTPKTLRIVHPEEAAKSSIWKTLGIKNEIVSNAGFKGLKVQGHQKYQACS